MSTPANLERFLGGFAYFVESGITVDAQTISPLIKPDMVPATNWNTRSLGTILEIKHGTKDKDNSYSRPSAAGGWEEVPRKFVIADHLDMKTREMGEQLLRLECGLTGAITEGTAQTPYAKTDRRIEGWLRLQARQDTGQDLLIMDVWASMELTEGLAAAGKVSEPKMRFSVIKTYNNAVIAGNSIVFPVTA